MRAKEFITKTINLSDDQLEEFYYYLENSCVELKRGPSFWAEHGLTFDRKTSTEFQEKFIETANWIYENADKNFVSTEIGRKILRFLGFFLNLYPEYEQHNNKINKKIENTPILYSVGDIVEYQRIIPVTVIDKPGEKWNSFHKEQKGIWPFKKEHNVKTINVKSPSYKVDKTPMIEQGRIEKIERDDHSLKINVFIDTGGEVLIKVRQELIIRKIG